MKLKINDYTTLNNAVSASEGEKIYDLIKIALEKNKVVELDFIGINLLTTAFLNSAIGQLYGEYKSEELSTRIELVNVSEEDLPRFKMVTDRAKLFYKDKESFSKTVNSVLDGER